MPHPIVAPTWARPSRRALASAAPAAGPLAFALLAGTLAACLAAPSSATTPLPCAPMGFTAEPLGVVVHLSWQATPGATGYRIYRGAGNETPQLALHAGPEDNETIDTQVEGGVTYTYRATAVIGDVETEDCGDAIVTAGGDCAPELFAAWQGQAIHLSWTGVVLADSYAVYRAEAGGDLEFLASVPSDEQSYLDQGVEGERAYAYQVRAVIDGQERPACNTAEVGAIPDFPTTWAVVAAVTAGVVGYAVVMRQRKRT